MLAADAATAAFTTGRLAHLLVAGVWVGLAFQAKMLQAWLVLPALYLAYLLAGPAPALSRRVGHVALVGPGGARRLAVLDARRHRRAGP